MFTNVSFDEARRLIFGAIVSYKPDDPVLMRNFCKILDKKGFGKIFSVHSKVEQALWR